MARLLEREGSLVLVGILAHREHFSKKTGIGVHDAITPHGYRLLRHQTLVGHAELNAEIMRLLTILNQKSFQKLSGCRESVFLAIDKPALKALPVEGYQFKKYKSFRAGMDYHVMLDNHFYSVPHRYSGELIDIWFNQHSIECYFEGGQIALHLYSTVVDGQSTIGHHMPKKHQQHNKQSKACLHRTASIEV